MTPEEHDTPEYQAFIESMVEHCRCREDNRPCEGVLAGAMCDNVQDKDEAIVGFGIGFVDDEPESIWGDE